MLCPDCLSWHLAPTDYYWFEVPLAFVFVQPYECDRCGQRCWRFRRPDLLLPSFFSKQVHGR